MKALLLPALLLLTGCSSFSYYTQAIRGQAEITFAKKSIARVLADPETSGELAEKLRLSQEIVDFAEQELGLPSSGSYRHYADLKRDHVVFIVHAAPKFSLEPHTWWYPVVGSQNYRGFFSKEDAQKAVANLQARGFETYLGGVNAYSTLGFFHDPILNTFIDYPQVDFAELIFHELTHHRYYEKEETAFNEALAEVVAREGVRRWLRRRGEQEALHAYELRLMRRSQIRRAIEESIARLKILYASEHPQAEMRRRKEAEMAALKETIQNLYAGWQQKPNHFLSTPLNNARLNAFTTYEALVPPLQALLARHQGNLNSFLEEIEKNGPSLLAN
ncbi:aminopeptidase [Roseibacillus ishigakijimensis]|uniref:Aminopeptidase n=1 Tax=Roseibacillus ishigakijimensis TaxID=454146 RepID=A0A934RK15_9BACT|nr:aminopeptidase [Roseibacillus ishigakijimensis]MBK1832859.1 aminopeptidase [Roseibacillus ishigakijimensis]